MKKHICLLLLLFWAGCLSTEQAARNRNDDFRSYNHYTETKFWRTIDIARFKNNLAQIRFAVLAEHHNLNDMLSESYLRSIRDTLHKEIEARNETWQALRERYFDSTATARTHIFTSLRSDSIDLNELEKRRNSPYYDLWQDLYRRVREAIEGSRFYRSQSEFEIYLQT